MVGDEIRNDTTKRAGSINDYEGLEDGEVLCAYVANNPPCFDEVAKYEAKQRHEYASNI